MALGTIAATGPAVASESHRPTSEGCSAWGMDSGGIGPSACRWEAKSPGGFWATGIVHFRVHRDGQVRDETWYVSCAAGWHPGAPAYSYFKPGDVVEVSVEVGWASVGPNAGMPCW